MLNTNDATRTAPHRTTIASGEINTLLKCKHENIVSVQEILVGSSQDQIYVAMEFVEHDMKGLLETMTQPFLASLKSRNPLPTKNLLEDT